MIVVASWCHVRRRDRGIVVSWCRRGVVIVLDRFVSSWCSAVASWSRDRCGLVVSSWGCDRGDRGRHDRYGVVVSVWCCGAVIVAVINAS